MTRQAIEQPLRQFLSELAPQQTLYVAYSGGVDSSVLLHALCVLQSEFDYQLAAFHIHHGLVKDADNWVAHCQAICQQLQIPLKIHYLKDKPKKGESLEAWARGRRREIFAHYLDRGDKLVVTAQHQNDQAETLLLQLLRGSGSRGLAAMPRMAPLASGRLARPLLSLSRNAILDYAERQGLRWVEDDSNRDTGFDRNYLRHQLWPVLLQRWPAAAETIARSAELLARDNRVLDHYCEQLLQRCSDDCRSRLALAGLASLEQDSQLLLVRYWMRQNAFNVPSSKRLRAALAMFLEASESANPSLQWGRNRLSRYRQHLYLHRQLAPLPENLRVPVNTSFFIDGIGEFCLEPAFPGFTLDAQHNCQIRFRRGGERLQLHSDGPHRSLKHLLQDWGVPPWLRARMPLLYDGDQLVAVADLAVAASFRAVSAQHSYRLRRLPNPSRSVLHCAFSDLTNDVP